jgi:hypothetical protein
MLYVSAVNLSSRLATKNQALSDNVSPFHGSAAMLTPNGTAVIAWQGNNASIILGVTQPIVRGGGNAPICTIEFPPVISRANDTVIGFVRVVDPDLGDVADLQALAIDGATIPWTARGDGLFQFVLDPQSLLAGPHVMNASASDSADLSSQCGISFLLNAGASANGPPGIVINEPAAGVAVGPTLLANGAFDDPDGDPVELFAWLDGASVSIHDSSNGTWELDSSFEGLGEGEHALHVEVVDAQGAAAFAGVRFSLIRFEEDAPPQCVFLSPLNGDTVPGRFQVTGLLSDPDGIEDILSAEYASLYGTHQALDISPLFSFSIAVPSGVIGAQVTVFVTDKSLARTACNLSVLVSDSMVQSRPSVGFNFPQDGAVVDQHFQVRGWARVDLGDAIDRVEVFTSDGGWFSSNGTAEWTANVTTTLEPGELLRLWAIAFGSNGSSDPARLAVQVEIPTNRPVLLLLGNMTVSPDRPFRAASMQISIPLTNYGIGTASGLPIRIVVTYLGPSVAGSSKTYVVFEGEVAQLDPGESTIVEAHWTPPQAGRILISAELDYGHILDPASLIEANRQLETEVFDQDNSPVIGGSDSATYWLAFAFFVILGLAFYYRRRRSRPGE